MAKPNRLGDSEDILQQKFKKYSPIRETEDENKLQSSNDDSDQYSSSKYDESSSSKFNSGKKKPHGGKSLNLRQASRKQADLLSSQVSSSGGVSNSGVFNAAAAQYSKHINDFMKEEDDDDESESLEKSKGAEGTSAESVNAMYAKYKKYQELLAKYSNDPQAAVGSGDLDDSSATVSKSN